MYKDRAIELAAAALLIVGHIGILLLYYGTETASVWGDWLGSAAALLAAVSSWTASRRAGPFGKRVWRLVCFSAFLALIGQLLYTYYYNYLHALDQLSSGDVLVYFWAVPALTSLFLSPRDPSSGFRWLRTCDFIQICTLVLAYELAAVYVPSRWQLAEQAMHRVFSVGLIFFGLVTISFLLRGLLTPFRTARKLFLRLAFFFFVFAITTNSTLYALSTGDYRQGIWPDVAWTATYCLLAVLASLWNDPERSIEEAPSRSRSAELLSQFSPLLIPAIVFPLVFSIAQERLFWSVALGMVSFAAASVRLFLVQNQLLVSSRRLKENHALLEAITQGTNDAIFVKDLQSRYLMVNPAGARNLRLRVEEMTGKETIEIFGPEIGRRLMDHDRVVLHSGKAHTFEEFVVAAGEPKVYLSTKAPYRDSKGQTIGLLGIARDITERIRAEEEIRQSQQKLRIHFDHTPLAVVEWDTEFRVVAWNSSAERIFGYSRQEAMAQHASFIFSPQLSEHTGQAWHELINHNRGKGRTIENVTKDGRSITCEWYNTPLVDSSGRVLGVASLVEDITDRVALDQKLRQSQKMEAIGRLAGGVAHDFNNLLTVINGYSNLALAEPATGQSLRHHLEEISKAGERAAALTRQLLAFSRKQVLQPRVLDLNSVLEDIQSMLARLVGEDVELQFTLTAESPRVQVDLHQLIQVIMNLAVNAREAMPRGGRLLVQTGVVQVDESNADTYETPAGRYAVLTVSDTGVGMDEETRQRIFEPFFTTKGHGTGLGLATVQGIVAQSAGHINVASELGRGTTFTIYLPALTGAEVDMGKPATAPAPRGRETVLVVEDQADVRDYAVAALEEYGYRTVKAANAGEALTICGREGEHIDLVLTDVVMPQKSGWELVPQLTEIRPGIKALFMSGYANIASDKVLEEGSSFIEKPFSPEELAKKIREVLGPARAARILVADDEPGVRSFLRAVLERSGYEVVEAAEGKQARALAGQVDLVITDLVMPEQDGIETIRDLRRESPEVRIIAFSGAFGGQLLRAAKVLGADAVLDKPVTPDALLGAVAEVLMPRS